MSLRPGLGRPPGKSPLAVTPVWGGRGECCPGWFFLILPLMAKRMPKAQPACRCGTSPARRGLEVGLGEVGQWAPGGQLVEGRQLQEPPGQGRVAAEDSFWLSWTFLAKAERGDAAEMVAPSGVPGSAHGGRSTCSASHMHRLCSGPPPLTGQEPGVHRAAPGVRNGQEHLLILPSSVLWCPVLLSLRK